MKKLCFVHCVDLENAVTQMFGVHYMPVWIYTLAPYIRDIPNLEITMFDIRITPKGSLPTADYYLFTGVNQDIRTIMNLFNKSKQQFPQAKFIIGGPIVWSYQQAGKIEELYEFDHLVVGDGEPKIKSLVENLIAGNSIPKIVPWDKKFEVSQTRTMDRILLDQTILNYYGAVIEVSRGCPFLCEFCDIRIQKDNNRANNVSAKVIVEELDYFARKGVKQVLFACDNFIGDPHWAEAVCDEIIEWKKRTGFSINLYTWLTINVSNLPVLLGKFRQAGFDMFFIGVESFESNSLLETAKIQNVKNKNNDVQETLVDAIKKIHAQGFVIVAGLIFGFDTDSGDAANSTLKGILNSGLISGEPSLLTALPGTPLYKRMKLSNRLRDGKVGLGGYKYQTNIKYLFPEEKMIGTFKEFATKYNKGKFQYSRFKKFTELVDAEKMKEMSSSGYINIFGILKMVLKNRGAIIQLSKRMLKLLSNPERCYYYFKTAFYVLKLHLFQGKKMYKYFNFWTYVWSNSVIKFQSLKPSEFDIGSVSSNFDLRDLVPAEYMTDLSEPIPEHKMIAQRKLTSDALYKMMESK